MVVVARGGNERRASSGPAPSPPFVRQSNGRRAGVPTATRMGPAPENSTHGNPVQKPSVGSGTAPRLSGRPEPDLQAVRLR